MILAIRQKNILLLWLGQLTSAIGDEVYRVAFVWMSVGFIGADTGFLVGAQVFVILLVTLFSGKWTDHWNHYRIMIWADILRGVLILIPVITTLFHPISYPVLWCTAVFISAISGIFEPALHSVVPEQCKDLKTLKSANGVMSTTFRTARVIAPMIIGFLTTIVPTIHFFTIDALTFFFSAYSIYLLNQLPKPNPDAASSTPAERIGIKKTLLAPIQILRNHPDVERAFYLKGMMAGAWWVTYFLGLALLVKQKFSSELTAYGFVLGAYGAGNLLGAIVFGLRERKKHEREMYFGFVVLAIGFIAMALASNLYILAITSAITAFAGPMNDLPYLDFVQSRFKQRDYTRIARFRISTETGFALIGFLLAPMLFRLYGPEKIILGCGVFILFLGLYGIKKTWLPSGNQVSLEK